MAKATFNVERAALVLADAVVMGDALAAKKWGMSDKSVRNYRRRLEEDDALASLFLEAKSKLVADWSADANVFMSTAMKKLVTLVGEADHPSQMGDVAKAVQVVGELLVSHEVLSAPEDHRQGQAVAADARVASRPLSN